MAKQFSARPSLQSLVDDYMTNLNQPMPRREKAAKVISNLWRRVVLRQNCCGHDGEPGC